MPAPGAHGNHPGLPYARSILNNELRSAQDGLPVVLFAAIWSAARGNFPDEHGAPSGKTKITGRRWITVSTTCSISWSSGSCAKTDSHNSSGRHDSPPRNTHHQSGAHALRRQVGDHGLRSGGLSLHGSDQIHARGHSILVQTTSKKQGTAGSYKRGHGFASHPP